MSRPDIRRAQETIAGAHQTEALAARFRAPLLRYFERRVRSPEDAEELTQDVFVRLLRRPEFDQIANLEGFVFITAANLLKDHYRSRAHRRETQSINGLDFASNAQNPAEEAEDREEIGVLLSAIRVLPPKCRAVFIMHRFDEVPHTEIARRLGITVSMVEKHIAVAMKHLRKTLHDGGHD
ncbi:MAG: sigma-70 family RNA polymerase sigma factor [Alphaproteobacteria bacterium]